MTCILLKHMGCVWSFDFKSELQISQPNKILASFAHALLRHTRVSISSTTCLLSTEKMGPFENCSTLDKVRDLHRTGDKPSLHWRHNDHDGVSNHQPHDCLLNRLFRRRSKKTSKLRVTGLCVGNSQFPAQRASYAENVSIWWRHHDFLKHWWPSRKYVTRHQWVKQYLVDLIWNSKSNKNIDRQIISN